MVWGFQTFWIRLKRLARLSYRCEWAGQVLAGEGQLARERGDTIALVRSTGSVLIGRISGREMRAAASYGTGNERETS